MAAERSVTVRIKAEYRAFKADMLAAGRAAEQAAEKMEKAGAKSASGTGKFLAQAKTHEKSWETAGNSLMGFGGIVTGVVGLSVAKYAAFDKAMSRVQAATHASKGDMELFRGAAISAGADTAFSAEEAAGAIEELSKAGVSASAVLSGGLAGALSLAAAGELDVSKAAEIAASALTQFKLEGDQIPHVADLLAAGAGKAQGSVEDLGMALNQSGLVAASTGLSIEETSGALAAFAEAGLTGSDAGTSFKTMLQSLNPNSDKAAGIMEDLGISAYDAEGAFIGMSEYAGVLQGALGDMSEEQRNATMKTLFGSDAVRAATILYENGAEGIEKWEKAVNQSGYAAQTAAIMQDNLAGDIEKLGGAFDTVFIQAGGGANDAIREIVKGVEGFVDAIGRIDPVAMSTIASIAGIVGVTALASGAFMRLVPAAIETFTAFRSLGTEGGKIPGTLGKIAKGAGIAAIALAGMQIIGTLISTNHVKTTTDYANAVMKVAEAGKKASSADLNSLFTGYDTMFGQQRSGTFSGSVDGIVDSVKALSNPSFAEGLDKNLNFMNSWFNLPSDKLTLIEERFAGLGQTLGELTANGGGDSAAKTFRLVAEEFEKNGKSAQDALNVMPEYAASLQQLALNAGQTVEGTDLLNWALSGTAPAAVQAAGAATQVAEELGSMGLAADGAVEDLNKFLESLLAVGRATMSSREATFGWNNTMRDSKDDVEAILKTQGKLGKVLNKNATDFNKNTDSGDAANKMFQEMAEQGMAVAEVYSKDVNKSQEDVQKQLTATHDGLISTAKAFGMSAPAAEALARSVLGIPKDVSIETWIDSQAQEGANRTKEALDNIPPMKNVKVIVTDEGTIQVTADQIQGIRERTISTTVTDEGTILEVQGGINNVKGKTEFLLVNDNGTVVKVQGRINKVTGKTEYIKVTDDGTVAGVQGKINRVKGKSVTISATYQTHGVPFKPSLSVMPGGKALGGRLPKNADGGRLPYTGLGTDKILGIGSNGTPTSWVDDGEWIIREAMSRKHNTLLGMINRDDPALARMGSMFRNLGSFAKGGKVSVSSAEKKVKTTKKAYDSINGKKTNKVKKAAAKKRYETAKKELEAAKKADTKAKEKAKEAAEKRQRISEGQFDLRRETARGDITESFTNGGGMGYVDKMFDLSNNKDLSKSRRAAIRSLAYKTEAALLKLEKRSDKVTKSLDKATDARDNLLSVRDSVRDGLKSETSIEGMLTKHYEYSTSRATAKGLGAEAKANAAKIKAFGAKLDKLRKMGYPSAVILEIAELGTLKGSAAADVLLKGTKADVKTFQSAYKDIEKYSNKAGQYVTESLAKGGLNASETLVKNLKKEETKVEKAFYELGKAGQKGFHKAWGIASPSKEAKKDAKHIVDGSVIGLKNESPRFSNALADMYYGVQPDRRNAAPGASAGPTVINLTAVVTNPFTGEQVEAKIKNVAVKEVPSAINANHRNNSRGGVYRGRY